jgi:uncharacterized membrane protein
MWSPGWFVLAFITLLAGYLYKKSSLSDNDLMLIVVGVIILVISVMTG